MEDRLSLVLITCHKLGQGDHVRSLHELNKSANVGEGQGRTKAFLDFLCIWTDKETSALHPQPSPNRNLDKTSLRMAHPSTLLALPQAVSCHTGIGPELFAVEHS
jgi:hypothetical protein